MFTDEVVDVIVSSFTFFFMNDMGTDDHWVKNCENVISVVKNNNNHENNQNNNNNNNKTTCSWKFGSEIV